MGAQPTGVLTPDDLNDTDGRVLDVLRSGRVTPQYVADQLDVSRTYASERLKRLVEHGHVERLASGLYELVDDPREDGATDDADLRAQLQTTLDDLDQARTTADRLRDERDDLEAQLEDCRDRLDDQDVDTDALRRALDDIEAAAQNGNGNGLQAAIERAREVLGDDG